VGWTAGVTLEAPDLLTGVGEGLESRAAIIQRSAV
jgi:hypothetical protein